METLLDKHLHPSCICVFYSFLLKFGDAGQNCVLKQRKCVYCLCPEHKMESKPENETFV